MKTKLNILVVLICVLTTLGQPTAAYAGSTRVVHSADRTAIATFISLSGCISTETVLTVSESRIRNEPGAPTRSSFAAVGVVQYDICTSTRLYFAYSTDFEPLSAEEFQISNTLDWATLNTTLPVFDEDSGTTFDLSINMTWTATSPVMREHVNEHLHTPHCIVNTYHQKKSRLAQAVGTVSYGSTNFTPEPSVDSVLYLLRNGTVVVGCDDE